MLRMLTETEEQIRVAEQRLIDYTLAIHFSRFLLVMSPEEK
jgi:hypothetical protein